MSITRNNIRRLAALAAVGLGLWVQDGLAFANFGTQINTLCQNFNGTTPYVNNDCGLCHVSDRGRRVEPQWTWWQSGPRENFCPPAANRAPNGTILAPSGPTAITAGQSVFFDATGSDPDGDPLSFAWNFGGGAANSSQRQPGNVTFQTPGSYTVRLTVTDDQGLADPTPPTRSITVLQPAPVCTDGDGDGFSREGGQCGPVDCDDGNAAVNPDAAESCTDGIDNDCNGLVDAADPGAQACPVPTGCVDFDRDGFSPEGGICGPLDCNDASAAVNPGAPEVCGDGADNDCDGATDGDDAECNGTDCVGELIDAMENEAPVCRIDSPRGNVTINAGQTVAFSGTATDPNGDALDLRWTFGGARADASVEDPGNVTFGQEGSFQVSFIATDDRGLACPPVTRLVTVQPAPQQTIDITEAEWDREDRELEVKGRWTEAGATASLFNAASGALLATTRTERDDGEIEFEFELERISTVPCRVRVEIDGQVGERDVDDAPADCDGGAPPANEAPTCTIDQPTGDVTIVAGQSVRFAGTGTDPDGDLPLRFAWNFDGGASNASVEDPGEVRFERQGSFQVSFRVTDARGLACAAPARRTVIVQPATNLAPVAADDTATTDEDTPVSIPVLANDRDPDGDSLTVSAVGQPSSGTATTDGNTVLFRPAANFNGTARLRYTVSDGRGGSDEAEVTVTVRPVNDPPVARNDAAATAEDTPITIAVLANDSDAEGNDLTVSAVSQPSSGTTSTNGETVVFRPAANFNGAVSFRYTASDGQGGSDQAEVSVTVRPVNDAPVARNDAVTVEAGRAATIEVLANDTDVDGDSLTIAQLGEPDNGTASSSGTTVTYIPDLGFRGTDSFTYRVSDRNGGTDTATITVTVRERDNDDEDDDEGDDDDEAEDDARVEIEDARWRQRRNVLRVSGENAPSRATVTVRVASTGQVLGTARAASDGDWRFRRRNPSVVPCRVRVEIGSASAERDVRRAPRDCR